LGNRRGGQLSASVARTRTTQAFANGVCVMRNLIYIPGGGEPLRWLGGTRVETPPVGEAARKELGIALRILQRGGQLAMPRSRSMPSIGPRCHELRVGEDGVQWRLIYRVDEDAVLVVDLFSKTSRKTPRLVLERARRRLRRYDEEQG
jgi:phage-related protein